MHPFLVPVVAIQMIFAPCPAYLPQQLACYEPATSTAYVPASDDTPMTRWHERGHAYDYARLTNTDRLHLTHLMGYQQPGWWRERPYAISPGEAFADRYADCALRKPYRIKQVCEWLTKRLAWRDAAKAASRLPTPST